MTVFFLLNIDKIKSQEQFYFVAVVSQISKLQIYEM